MVRIWFLQEAARWCFHHSHQHEEGSWQREQGWLIKLVSSFLSSKLKKLPKPSVQWRWKIRLPMNFLCRGIMYCTILCTKEADCIGTKAEEGSCYLYKNAIAGFNFDETSKISSGVWLRLVKLVAMIYNVTTHNTTFSGENKNLYSSD